MNEIMVSVLCPVYNHEKYLRKCLDGILMQKTTFPFEVIVHDDASTDRSADIIQEYEKNYPHIIKPIYQTENQYSKNIKIWAKYLTPNIKGKYVAICEGDDYWCDENKMQAQYEALEKHKDCHLCVHTVCTVREDGEKLDATIPAAGAVINEGTISQHKFFEMVGTGYAFQTSSYFLVTEDFKKLELTPPKFKQIADVGDEPILMFFGMLGDVYYLRKEMSCYRIASAGSWSGRIVGNKNLRLKHVKTAISMYDEFNIFTGNRFQKELAPIRRDLSLSQCLYKHDKESAVILLKPENRDFFNKQEKRTRFMIYMRAYCSLLAKLYYKIKESNNA